MRIAWVLPDGERTRKFNKLVKSSPAVTIKRKEPKLTIATEEWAVIEQAQSFICSNAVKALRVSLGCKLCVGRTDCLFAPSPPPGIHSIESQLLS